MVILIKKPNSSRNSSFILSCSDLVDDREKKYIFLSLAFEIDHGWKIYTCAYGWGNIYTRLWGQCLQLFTSNIFSKLFPNNNLRAFDFICQVQWLMQCTEIIVHRLLLLELISTIRHCMIRASLDICEK